MDFAPGATLPPPNTQVAQHLSGTLQAWDLAWRLPRQDGLLHGWNDSWMTAGAAAFYESPPLPRRGLFPPG